RRRHTRLVSDWSSDVCSSDLFALDQTPEAASVMNVQETSFRVPTGVPLDRGASFQERVAAVARVAAADAEEVDRNARFPRAAIRSEERRVGKECRCGGRRGQG